MFPAVEQDVMDFVGYETGEDMSGPAEEFETGMSGSFNTEMVTSKSSETLGESMDPIEGDHFAGMQESTGSEFFSSVQEAEFMPADSFTVDRKEEASEGVTVNLNLGRSK